MEARFIKSGKTISGKAAEVFVRIGIAEQLAEMPMKEEKPAKEQAKRKVTKRKPATKKRGRPTKKK